jgi:hypothetical protein
MPDFDAIMRKSMAVGDLLTLMHDLSEDCWDARWCPGLEYVLWGIVTGDRPNTSFGKCPGLYATDVKKLQSLAEEARGWWVWDAKQASEVFVSMEKWTVMYAERKP